MSSMQDPEKVPDLYFDPQDPNETRGLEPVSRHVHGWVRFDRQVRTNFLELVAQGIRPMTAARASGIRWQTVKRTAEADPFFAQRLMQARMEANEQVEDAMFNAAVSGNVTAAIFWLQNQDPEHWQDKRAPSVIQVNGRDGVQVNVPVDELRAKAFAELAEFEAERDELTFRNRPVIDVQEVSGE